MRAFEQRKKNSAGSSSFFGPKIQKKLKTGTPGDQFEVEADKVADQVVSNNSPKNGLLQSKEEIQQKPLSETITSVQSKGLKEEEPVQKKTEEKEEPVQKKEEEKEPVQKKADEKEEAVQAKCDDCEKEDKGEKVQKKENGKKSEKDDSDIEGRLNQSRGSGSPMDKDVKNEMESKFGSDFSNVNIHTNSNAVQMSQDMGAQAFTNGNDVYFNKGKYNPNTKEGKHLLAHELTHTVQQTGAKQKTPAIQKSLNEHPEDLRAEKPENPQYARNPPLEKANDNEMLISTGHKGGYVSEIQAGLLEWNENALPNYGADGDFGSETRNAVLDFQIDQGLKGQEGIVGPETMGTLDNFVLAKNGGKKETPICSDPDTGLPKMVNPFNFHDFVLSSGEFSSMGSFKITSTGNWAKKHPVEHYHLSVIEFIPGTTKSNRIRRRFDVGKSETQTFNFPKDKCVSFKVLIEVINPTKKSPNLVGNFSVFH